MRDNPGGIDSYIIDMEPARRVIPAALGMHTYHNLITHQCAYSSDICSSDLLLLLPFARLLRFPVPCDPVAPSIGDASIATSTRHL